MRDLGRDDFIKVMEEINAEEHRHVGQLQEMLSRISDSAKVTEDGKKEASEQLSENPIDPEQAQLLANLLTEARKETISAIIAKIPNDLLEEVLNIIKEKLGEKRIEEDIVLRINSMCNISDGIGLPEYTVNSLIDNTNLMTQDSLTIKACLIPLLIYITDNYEVNEVLKAILLALPKEETLDSEENKIDDEKSKEGI